MKSNAQRISADRLWLVMMKAHRSIAAYVETRMSGLGIGMSDFMVLEVLLHKGPLTISAIGEKVLLTSASMTSAIDRLEERELVVRKTCDSDRRVRYVELTAAGRKFISGIYARHERDLDFLVEGLSDAERRAIYEGMKKLGFRAKEATGKS
ncbi:MarR family transcriptional regulator [Edaphobacter acidisoli]|uniref:MarR family transcriptional regulator n=1 Tax=Edaphobacter acidisoli TaxID=2040573 RepID=A0A916RTA8_9BACT|nr:MarR family transcriptional regulator [Edaphobacter acidisoli]GGA69249.1 MarR family transcriptional regulator [Edaphobacter acidisoli]